MCSLFRGQMLGNRMCRSCMIDMGIEYADNGVLVHQPSGSWDLLVPGVTSQAWSSY